MSRSSVKTGALNGKPVMRALPEGPVAEKVIADLNLAGGKEQEIRGRIVRRLNRDWLFHRGEMGVDGEVGEDKWEPVILPHSVRLEPLNASGGRNYQGVCWYSRELRVPADWKNRIVYLHFEGAMQVAKLWVNDQKAATHSCGYTPFVVDITGLVRFGGEHNRLTLRLDNRDNPQVPPGKSQKDLDFSYFGGLYRNVRLEVVDRLHISDAILADRPGGGGVLVSYPNVETDKAIVRVRTDVQNEFARSVACGVRQELIDADGRVVASEESQRNIAAGGDVTFNIEMEVNEPRLWHPHEPNLYTLRTTVMDESRSADVQEVPIGIRHIRFDSEEGLFINGRKFLSMGVNRHQDHPYVGYALPDSAHWRDVKKLREAGFTSFRSHYPQAPAFMDACDRLGMLTIVSNPGWQFVGDENFRKQAVQNAREMVRRDRNRPSVILWEAALNESDNSSLAEELRTAIHEEFPGEQCFTAGDREEGFAAAGFGGWEVEYLNNNKSKPYWIREWGDQVDNWSDQQSSNRVARGWGEVPMLVQAWSHLKRMNEILVGHNGSDSGKDGKRLAGACLWAGIDCQRGYHHQPFYGGVLDLFRLPKFDYFLFQSQRPADVRVPGLDDGPMVFIANFATFVSPTSVTVFSNCEQVRLVKNGVEVAMHRPDAGHRIGHPPFTFQIGPVGMERSTMYMTGVAGEEQNNPLELRAEGLIGGKVVASHVVRPPGAPRKLVVEADLCGWDLSADGSDWVRVYAKVCDALGTVCPFADDMIAFNVEGEGEIIGGAEIGANPMRAEAGIATGLVRGTTRAGKLVVTANAFGLASGSIEIISQQAGEALSLAASDGHEASRALPTGSFANQL